MFEVIDKLSLRRNIKRYNKLERDILLIGIEKNTLIETYHFTHNSYTTLLKKGVDKKVAIKINSRYNSFFPRYLNSLEAIIKEEQRLNFLKGELLKNKQLSLYLQPPKLEIFKGHGAGGYGLPIGTIRQFAGGPYKKIKYNRWAKIKTDANGDEIKETAEDIKANKLFAKNPFYPGTAISNRNRSDSAKKNSVWNARKYKREKDQNLITFAANRYLSKMGMPDLTYHDNVIQFTFDHAGGKRVAKYYDSFPDVNSGDYQETDKEKYILDTYKEQFPKIIKDYNIKSYKDLVNHSYEQLSKEIGFIYDEIPLEKTVHEGDQHYDHLWEMVDDIYNFKHISIHNDKTPHPLNEKGDDTGITTYAKLKAIENFFGHAEEGYEHNKEGKENAWLHLSKMFTPLAQWSLTSEIRGKNMWEYLSGENDAAMSKMVKGRQLAYKGQTEKNDEIMQQGVDLMKEGRDSFKKAPIKIGILPANLTHGSFYRYTKHKNLEVPDALNFPKLKQMESERGDESKRSISTLNFNFQKTGDGFKNELEVSGEKAGHLILEGRGNNFHITDAILKGKHKGQGHYKELVFSSIRKLGPGKTIHSDARNEEADRAWESIKKNIPRDIKLEEEEDEDGDKVYKISLDNPFLGGQKIQDLEKGIADYFSHPETKDLTGKEHWFRSIPEGWPTTKVKISDIHPSQKDGDMYDDKVQHYVKHGFSKRPPVLLHDKVSGKYYVNDGHHRIASNVVRGEKFVNAYVLPRHLEEYSHLFKKGQVPLIEKGLNKIVGGKADKADPKDFDQEQLKMGIEVELEHTKDQSLAMEIAMDHLKEFPDYYTRLKKVEKGIENPFMKGDFQQNVVTLKIKPNRTGATAYNRKTPTVVNLFNRTGVKPGEMEEGKEYTFKTNHTHYGQLKNSQHLLHSVEKI